MANFLVRSLFNALLIITALLVASLLLPTTAAQPPQAAATDRVGLQQLYNIIDALIGSGDFGNWANILSTTDPSMFPLSATLFVPGDSAFLPLSDSLSSAPDPPIIDPFLFSYHIVPQRLSFSDLTLFPLNSQLPTLLIDRSIVITNNTRSNFTLNGSRLTRPDLFSTSAISVHGIRDVLDYTAGHSNQLHIPQSPPESEPDNTPPLSPQKAETPISTQVAAPVLEIDKGKGITSQASGLAAYIVGFMPIVWSVFELIKIL